MIIVEVSDHKLDVGSCCDALGIVGRRLETAVTISEKNAVSRVPGDGIDANHCQFEIALATEVSRHYCVAELLKSVGVKQRRGRCSLKLRGRAYRETVMVAFPLIPVAPMISPEMV